MPWYLKILQELCAHEYTITVTSSCVTCETIEARCGHCNKSLYSITEC